jgi:survival-of-motor-neuron-related-splicing factor 30
MLNAAGSKKKRKTHQGLKKGSIFATPEDSKGKVGVVGSGKEMTGNEQRRKHEFRFGSS